MKSNRMIWLAVLFVGLIMACHHRKSGNNEGGDFSTFLQHFQPVTVPFSYSEDSLAAALPDSSRLVYKETTGFIPDSIWYPNGKNSGAAKVYPLGKNHFGKLNLLWIRALHGSSDEVDLLLFNNADTLVSVMNLMKKKSSSERSSFELDNKYLLHLNEQKYLSNGEVIKREDVYGINKNGTVNLILTNTNQPSNPNSFYNPIDTLPQKHRYSGDYFIGKADVVSIRDGHKEGTFRFFIHLNKNNGDCTGEIDGTGTFEKSSIGIYKEENGPCGIRFTFSGSKVTLAEVGGCGAYRGISCNYTGTYTKKGESKPKK